MCVHYRIRSVRVGQDRRENNRIHVRAERLCAFREQYIFCRSVRHPMQSASQMPMPIPTFSCRAPHNITRNEISRNHPKQYANAWNCATEQKYRARLTRGRGETGLSVGRRWLGEVDRLARDVGDRLLLDLAGGDVGAGVDFGDSDSFLFCIFSWTPKVRSFAAEGICGCYRCRWPCTE